MLQKTELTEYASAVRRSTVPNGLDVSKLFTRLPYTVAGVENVESGVYFFDSSAAAADDLERRPDVEAGARPVEQRRGGRIPP